MNELKRVEFKVEKDNITFEVTLKYGMQENESNHVLVITIDKYINVKTGQHKTVKIEDITDLLPAQDVYGKMGMSYEESKEVISKHIDSTIQQIIDSDKNKETTIDLLEDVEKLYDLE